MNFSRQGAEARGESCADGLTKRTSALRAALTVDLHATDRPEDILACATWLEAHALRATFFVPTRMFEEARFSRALHALARGPHELGTHAHHHDWTEVEAALATPSPPPSTSSTWAPSSTHARSSAPRGPSDRRRGAT